jgi:N-acetylneuraminic acid mutarotase
MATLNDKVVLFGGFDGDKFLGDTWEWDGSRWTERKVLGPPPRGRYGMATLKGKVVVHGGQTDSGTLGDTWEWDGNTWTERKVSPNPGIRGGHAMATLDDKIVLVSGARLGHYEVNTWEWDGDAWTELDVAGPTARAAPGMAALQGKLIFFGGVVLVGGSMYQFLSDTWAWDGKTWTKLDVSGPVGAADVSMSSR